MADEGFYVTVRDGGRSGFLLGPYGTRAGALGQVGRVRRYVSERNDRSWFYGFGTGRLQVVEGARLPAGQLNGDGRLRLWSAEGWANVRRSA